MDELDQFEPLPFVKTLPRILCVGVVAASSQVASAADYQYTRSAGTSTSWTARNPSTWNVSSPYDGEPPAGTGPTINDNLDLSAPAGAALIFSNSDSVNFGIRNLSASSAGQALVSGSNGVAINFTVANDLTVLSGAGLSIYHSNNNRNIDVSVGRNVSVEAGATLALGNLNGSTNVNAHRLRSFLVSGTTFVTGTLASQMANGSPGVTTSLGDLVINSGGVVNMAVAGAITADNTSSRTFSVRSLAGEGALYASDAVQAGVRSSILAISGSLSATFSGVLADSFVTSAGTNVLHVAKSGTSRQSLTGVSTYTGTTSVLGGTLAVERLADGGSASSIGASGSAAGNLILDGGALEYTGGAATTNRLFTLGAGGAALVANGSGAVTFSNTGDIVLEGSGARTLTFGGANTGANTFTSRITDGAGGATSVQKTDDGTWVLSGTHSYTGATVLTGGKLVVDGSIAASSGVIVGAGAVLGGHGSVSHLSGAGTVAAGNSPGILTAETVDGSAGLDFVFEFTTHATGGESLPTFGSAAASGNDLLRITDAAPFVLELTAANTVTVDFSAVTLEIGDRYLGGFYADAGDFANAIANAQFQFVGLDGFYINVATVQHSANFGNGVIDGFVTEFTVVPEPGTMVLFGLPALALAAMLRRRK